MRSWFLASLGVLCALLGLGSAKSGDYLVGLGKRSHLITLDLSMHPYNLTFASAGKADITGPVVDINLMV